MCVCVCVDGCFCIRESVICGGRKSNKLTKSSTYNNIVGYCCIGPLPYLHIGVTCYLTKKRCILILSTCKVPVLV